MAKTAREAEFTAYVASRSGWLRKVAYLLCGDWHRADDLVQESISKLYVNWPRAGRVENVDGYARKVLVNTFLAEQRSPWWRRTTRSGVEPDTAGTGVDLDASLDLRKALAALPESARGTGGIGYGFAAALGAEHTSAKVWTKEQSTPNLSLSLAPGTAEPPHVGQHAVPAPSVDGRPAHWLVSDNPLPVDPLTWTTDVLR
ncbi:sigma factor [Kitasatospora sp. NPDC091207]|uniref:sigma factor n=1 Tax=Kitasatospora sp. NPDC091207 TaxID=3364083 RepID=UPI0038305291